jgi:REP element-mobilizing transposase RayT
MVWKMQIARGMALAWPIPECRMRSRVAAHIRKLQSEAKNMARTPRIKSSGEGTAYYHLISRCSNRQFLFRKAAAKDRLMDLAKRAAEFSGVKLLALTVMDNHFHILCSVTQSNEPVSQEEIIRRIGVLKGESAAEEVRKRWENLAAAGFTSMLAAELDRYRARMNDISAFVKTLKELFAIWYNRRYDYCGSIWCGVFKSTMIESGRYLEYCRRYVIMNPVRAGMVTQIKAYRWVWSDNADEISLFAGSDPRGGRVVQIGEGKVFGSAGFVRMWIGGMASRHKDAHEVLEIGSLEMVGYSSHGWRLANSHKFRGITERIF